MDDGLDVSHDAEGDSNGDHGTHVAGIAAANRYVPHYDADGDLYYDKQELGVTGVAPDAQLVVMKVFGVGGGAYSSDYMAAIEDAIWLNCDSVNLSLGSGSAGRSYGSKSDQQILDSFRNTDTVVTVSAGNNGAWGENVLTGTGMTYTTDVRMHTGGSPGSYTNSFTIASVTNTSMSGVMGKFNGVAAIPGDTGETYGAKNFSTLDTSEDQSGTTYDYVFLGDPVKGEGIYGLPENYANVDVKPFTVNDMGIAGAITVPARELCKRRREGQGRPDLPRQFFVCGQGQRGHSGRCRGGRHLQQRARLHQHEPDGL